MLEREIPPEIKNLAKAFRYFVHPEVRSYNFVDRIANATTPEIAIEALKDALRVLKSAHDRGDEKVEYLPSNRDVEKFMEYILKDIYYAKIFASLVFVWPSKAGSKQELEGGE